MIITRSNLLSSKQAAPVAGATGLEIAANALSLGQSATYTPGIMTSITDTNDHDWVGNNQYDAVHKKVNIFLKAASSDEPYQHWQFDEATETLSQIEGNILTALGHIYDNSAIDPATGDVYLAIQSENVIRRGTYSTGSWDFTTVTGTYANASFTSPPNGLAWHPNLYGSGDGGLLIGTRQHPWAWRKSTNTFEQVVVSGQGVHGSTSGPGFYVAADDVAYIMGGAGPTYRFPAGSGGSLGAPVDVSANLPINLVIGGGSGSHARMIEDPKGTGHLYILEANGTARVWKSTDQSANWTLQGFTHPMESGSNFAGLTVILPYKVILGTQHQAEANASLLWKPTL